MIAILDYKAGNQTSVRRALEHLGIECRITADPDAALSASGIIFPGVGAAGQAMAQLAASGLDGVLRRAVEQELPLLGICLGCQIMMERSEENDAQTLGLMPGLCRKFDAAWQDVDKTPIRIPHMGWNTLLMKKSSPLFEGIDPEASFYFVHSYYVDTAPEHVIATTVYGREFCSAYGRDGLWAVQFHPEKSGRPGLRLLANFARFCGVTVNTAEAALC
ncbi:MAG: imidazole glycerol phosphate synthase subunit HisH [Desulfovibrionaceae bacterium]|nr:imidazole glycerol phosphate synthase subunit HisH [Desulfovibrionaceae bacterium]